MFWGKRKNVNVNKNEWISIRGPNRITNPTNYQKQVVFYIIILRFLT